MRLLIAVALVFCASQAAAQPAGMSQLGGAPRYIAAAHLDATRFLPPPPAPGSAMQAAELSVVRAAQALKGSPRWRQAQSDDDPSPFKAFAPVLGPRFTRTAAPKTAALLDALTADMGSVLGPAKKAFGRQRPPLVDPSLQTCAPLEQTGSYPSGAGTLGWLTALVLSQMVPEQANAILDRGRDFGDSRVVCAEHFPSDVRAGRVVGAAVFAAAEADPGFERDFQAAKAELRAALGL